MKIKLKESLRSRKGTLIRQYILSHHFMQNNNKETEIVGGTAILFLALAILFPSTMVDTLSYNAYAQANATNNFTPNTPNPSQNTTATTTGTGVTDFKTLRDQYLAQWQQLNFQSNFDTSVEPYSA